MHHAYYIVESKMGSDEIINKIPEDIVIHMLLRVPVKSLLRFKCISKFWYDQIQSSIFINLYCSLTTAFNEELILFKRSVKVGPIEYNNVLSFLSIDGNYLKPIYPDLYAPSFTCTYGVLFYEILGPCNGLIALTNSENIILFNPATRNYIVLPPSSFTCPKRFRRSMSGGIGFGLDRIGNDYKFVKISEIFRDPPRWDPRGEREQKVDIYDLRNNSWRELDYVGKHIPDIHWFPCFEILYKGAFHWYAYTDVYSKLILCFDMITEIFRVIKMPESCHYMDGKRYSLVILNESLTLICYVGTRKEVDLIEDETYIWVMKEYGVNDSWIMKYKIRPLQVETPIMVWKDHFLLLQSKSGLLISYDINSDEFKDFNLYDCAESLRIIIYKESLTPIPKVEQSAEQSSEIFEKWRKPEY